MIIREYNPDLPLDQQVDVQVLFIQEGAPGPAGPPNTLTIGTVQTGTPSAATITGSAPNQVLNLVLEKGEKGATGDSLEFQWRNESELRVRAGSGEWSDWMPLKGEKGEKGDTGPQGPAGTADLSGDDDTVMPHEPLLLRVDERTVTLTRDQDGRLTMVEERAGGALVKRTTLTRAQDGLLDSVVEEAGGVTVTTTLHRVGGELTSVTREVV